MPCDAPPPITPAMKVAQLLEAYPELESVLAAQAPAFARLKNPILRRTVARVATLEQAAGVGGLEVRDLVACLRRAAGQEVDEGSLASAPSRADVFSPARPDWVDTGRLCRVLDADQLIAVGRVPLPAVAEAARALEPGEVLRVDVSFRPLPMIDAMGTQGFRCWARQAGPARFEAFFARRP